MTTVVEEKTYDKRDRAIKAAQKALGENATEGEDFELKRLGSNKRWYWGPLKVDQPKVGDRVYLATETNTLGKVIVSGPSVCEVKWENGKTNNELNSYLRVSDGASPPKKEDPTLSLGFLGPLPESKEEEGIPEFLQVKNRGSLTAEQKTALDKRMKEARADSAAEAKRSTTLPKNIEAAGLEILAAKAPGKKLSPGNTGGQASPDNPPLRLRSACELYNSLAQKAGFKPRKINTTGFSGKPDAVRALKNLEARLKVIEAPVPAEIAQYLAAWSK